MALIDYKFWYVKRDDNGFITEAAIRFYEGEYQTKLVKQDAFAEGTEQEVYIRTKRLETKDLISVSLKPVRTESSGKETFLYTDKDFGKIKTDDELRAFLDRELDKETSRTPILEQKWRA